jgi:hypothetical protein
LRKAGFDFLVIEGKAEEAKYIVIDNGKSLDKIKNTLTIVKRELKVKRKAEWLGEYYQYANRIAYLYLLTIVGQVPAWMVFLYFVGDMEQNGPATAGEWDGPLKKMRQALGLPQRHLLSEAIINVYAPATSSRR